MKAHVAHLTQLNIYIYIYIYVLLAVLNVQHELSCVNNGLRKEPLIICPFLHDFPCHITALLFRLFIYIYRYKVAVGPKRSTNINLKQITMIECTKTVIFQLLRHPDISELAKRELIQ